MKLQPGQVILDANILLRLSDISNPVHATTQNAVINLLNQGMILRTIPQTLFEFWSVATRPAKINGLGLTVAGADREIAAFLQSFPLLPDDPAQTTFWRHLVVKYGVTGKQSHDARYVASMLANGLIYLLTYDQDFNRYLGEGVILVDPAKLSVSTT